jgi:hypothetical protein
VMFEWSSQQQQQQQQLRRLGDVSINHCATSATCGRPVGIKAVPRCPTGEPLVCCCCCCYEFAVKLCGYICW